MSDKQQEMVIVDPNINSSTDSPKSIPESVEIAQNNTKQMLFLSKQFMLIARGTCNVNKEIRLTKKMAEIQDVYTATVLLWEDIIKRSNGFRKTINEKRYYDMLEVHQAIKRIFSKALYYVRMCELREQYKTSTIGTPQ